MQVTINLLAYNELSKSAQAVVIQDHLDREWFDYSMHDRSDFDKCLNAFKSAFNTLIGMGDTKGEAAKKLIVQAINKAAEIHAKNNEFYADSFNKDFGGKITTVEKAIEICGHGLFEGMCEDFYLTDTIVDFLSGKNYQNSNIRDLVNTAVKNGRNTLNAQCRFYQTKKHVHQCLSDQCVDWFFEDGSKVHEYLVKKIQAA